jgi:hypothetical protein
MRRIAWITDVLANFMEFIFMNYEMLSHLIIIHNWRQGFIVNDVLVNGLQIQAV